MKSLRDRKKLRWSLRRLRQRAVDYAGVVFVGCVSFGERNGSFPSKQMFKAAGTNNQFTIMKLRARTPILLCTIPLLLSVTRAATVLIGPGGFTGPITFVDFEKFPGGGIVPYNVA